MAYAAVTSLKQTIHRLLNSPRISIVSPGREILELAYKEVMFLQESLITTTLNALDGQIRDAACKLEDILESHVSNQFFLQCENTGGQSHPLLFSTDMQDLKREVRSFIKYAWKLKRAYRKSSRDMSPEELDNHLAEEDDDHDAAASSSIDFGVEMVGLSEYRTEIKNQVLKSIRPDDFGVFSFVGLPGSSVTFDARTIFEDLYIGKEQRFDCGAWVTIGPKYQLKEILVAILAQIDGRASNDELHIISEGEEKNIAAYLHTSLKGRRYIVALDDVCDTQTWDLLKTSFPEQNNGSLVLLTTKQKEVALFANSLITYGYAPMNEDHMWDFLCLGIFGVNSCPPEFEEAGKKIVKNCHGLRIPFAKVMLFLKKAEKTPEYWNKIAAEEENSIFMVADETSEVCKIKEDMQLYDLSPDDDERNLTIELAKKLIDFSGETKAFKALLFPERFFPKMEIISFFGMAGIGKTTLVRTTFEHPSILGRFDHRVWVTLGPKYQSEKILVDVLAQIHHDIDKMHMKEDSGLAEDLCEQLSYKRCLIVLDDVWSIEPLHYLKKFFQDIKGVILVTTRQASLTEFGEGDTAYNMRLLDKEESWSLFYKRVFAEESCPPELEKVGKKIAENCEGLPLTIVTVANLLSQAEKTPEYWNRVAEKQNSVFVDAYDEISKVLYPSYENLPQNLKVCFLYMGVFLQNYEISRSKLIKLWIAEGFLEPNLSQTIEDFAIECLVELVDRNLVLVHENNSKFEPKTCRLHSVFWHLANIEALKTKFFYALNGYVDNPKGSIKPQRRLCIRNSILLGIKDVHNSIASISTAHSLLCIGPPHQYPVPVCLNLRLIRVLDALTIRFYEFPIEVVKLLHLRYLALTYNGKLPSSISKLWNLQYLIVSRHLSIKSFQDTWSLPVEIWDMKELKHIQIIGSNLLHDPNFGALLPNLLTLSDVSADSCTKRVLKRIPNLKRLGIQIDLAPDDDGKPFRCLNHISHLRTLESLKCIVMYRKFKVEAVAPPSPDSMFPLSLRKLSLSGLGFPWEYMSIIGKLPNLEELKLRCYAFRGPEWETEVDAFSELKFLLVEDTDLVRWKLKLPSFKSLKSLSMKHCYNLEELPSYLTKSIEMIEIVDCNPFTVTWAKQMKEKDLKYPITFEHLKLQLQVHSSWEVD